jgi:hypothetical protein
MAPFRLGQEIMLDLFCLDLCGRYSFHALTMGTVVALHPGVITVRLHRPPLAPTEVTVSRHRVIDVAPVDGHSTAVGRLQK